MTLKGCDIKILSKTGPNDRNIFEMKIKNNNNNK